MVDDWRYTPPPCCRVAIYAQETPTTAPYLQYPVHVKGIDPEDTFVCIQRQLANYQTKESSGYLDRMECIFQ